MQAQPQRSLRFHLPAGRYVLAGALAVGLAGDYLLRGTPWGLGFTTWVVLGVAAAVASAPAGSRRHRAVELAPALLFAAALALRDSRMLRDWNVIGAVLWLVVPVVRRSGVRIAAAGIGDFAVGAVRAAWGAARGPLRVAEAPDPPAAAGAGHGSVRAVAIGAMLALLLLFVFGGLLRSADAAFDRALGFLWHWDFDVALSHVALTVLLAWAATGYLAATRDATAPVTLFRGPSLGRLEIALPLGALAVLFLAFDTVQVQYVVGGAAFVRDTLGLSFADHARRGFFQLIATTGLVLAVLVGGAWVLRTDDAAAARAYRRLSSLVLIAAVPIPVSAFWRLGLYVQAYGLTEERLYGSAVMVWIVWCLGWLAYTVLRLEARRFAGGAWVAGFVTLVLVTALDPDAVIARVNLDRARQGAALDVAYLGALSADAAPTVLGSEGAIDAAARCTLMVRWGRGGEDWRSWNVGRWRARRIAAAATGCP